MHADRQGTTGDSVWGEVCDAGGCDPGNPQKLGSSRLMEEPDHGAMMMLLLTISTA